MTDRLFNVVQVAQSDSHAVEIISSCAERGEADRIAEAARQDDETGHFDYVVTDVRVSFESGVPGDVRI